jgi:hypothetical protein
MRRLIAHLLTSNKLPSSTSRGGFDTALDGHNLGDVLPETITLARAAGSSIRAAKIEAARLAIEVLLAAGRVVVSDLAWSAFLLRNSTHVRLVLDTSCVRIIAVAYGGRK